MSAIREEGKYGRVAIWGFSQVRGSCFHVETLNPKPQICAECFRFPELWECWVASESRFIVGVVLGLYWDNGKMETTISGLGLGLGI